MKISSLIIATLCATTAYASDLETLISILQPTSYAESSIQDVKSNDLYVAMLLYGNSLVARHVNITVTKEAKPHSNGEPMRTVHALPNTLFLLKGLNIPEGKVFKKITFDSQALEAGKSVILVGKKGSVTLSSTGIQEQHDPYTHDYRLFATVNEKSTEIIPLTTAEFTPQLVFAGDLNDDGYPEFAFHISTDTRSEDLALFLSQASGQDITYAKSVYRNNQKW